jgi:hypothetical protein
MSAFKKFDGQKPTPQYIYAVVRLEEAACMALGEKRYGSWNYLEPGVTYSRLLGAIQRHVDLFSAGENEADDTGLSHLAHARCGLGMLYAQHIRRTGADDRMFDPANIERIKYIYGKLANEDKEPGSLY